MPSMAAEKTIVPERLARAERGNGVSQSSDGTSQAMLSVGRSTASGTSSSVR